MSNWSSGLSRSASRWAFQVSASLGATLIAALIVQSLPRAMPEVPAPAPELTSGGKFAARAAAARAYDGLDTMPLPHVDVPNAEPPATVVPAAFLTSTPTDLAGLGAMLRQPAVDGPITREHAKPARLAHAPVRTEARRTAASVGMSHAPTDGRDGTSTGATIAEAAEGGLLHQVASTTRQVWSSTSTTTRDAWSATASVGSSLVSRLIP